MSAEIAAMKRSGTSVIVNNASVDGLRGYPFPGGAAYSAAKHGVIGLTRSAALEHAVQGPRICAICPGWIDTAPVAGWMKRNKEVAQAIIKQTPRGTIGEPDEIAAAVLWLCFGSCIVCHRHRAGRRRRLHGVSRFRAQAAPGPGAAARCRSASGR
jgi:NAD(P)-dependent dehydrogenase (short-subunit alcohol dehydrogenase family)